MLDHLLGHLDVGDHAGAKRADGADVAWRLAEHQLGILADRVDLADAIDDFHRDDRRLAGDDALAAHVNDRVGGAEVDRNVAGCEVEQKTHWTPRPYKNRNIKGLGQPSEWAIWLTRVMRGSWLNRVELSCS